MSNDQCHIGAANKAKIDANEKRITDLSKSIDEICERFDESQQILLNRMDLLHQEFTKRIDRVLERFSSRPSWTVMLILSGLSSLCVGLIVYLASGGHIVR